MKNGILNMSRGVLWALCVFGLLLAGCRKEEETMTTRAEIPIDPRLERCKPDHDVVGHWELCDVLIEAANCIRGVCTHAVYSPAYDHDLGYVINSAATVNVALQTAILNDALAWADANAPAGYSIQHIGFYPNNPYQLPDNTYNASIAIKVFYFK